MDDQHAWDLYFSGIVGWSCHPGYLKDPEKKLDLYKAADLATEMVAIRRQRWPG